jgi:Rrf2 family protein
MLLSLKCRYGIKSLIYISKKSGFVKSSAICQEEKIPPGLLKEIMAALIRHEIIIGKTGKAGGFKLSMPIDQIDLYSIVKILNKPIMNLVCINEGQVCEECKNTAFCNIRLTMKAVNDNIITQMKKTSLKDFII